jgi:hypothetical protein
VIDKAKIWMRRDGTIAYERMLIEVRDSETGYDSGGVFFQQFANDRVAMESVYLETSFISYLVARPSRDLIIAGHQQISQEWWAEHRLNYDCAISVAVIEEASLGDPDEIQKRLAILETLTLLEVTPEAAELTKAILSSKAIPPRAAQDAAHVAVAAVHAIDYLLTWNCKHLANARIIRRVRAVCEDARMPMPIVCTPEELMEARS